MSDKTQYQSLDGRHNGHDNTLLPTEEINTEEIRLGTEKDAPTQSGPDDNVQNVMPPKPKKKPGRPKKIIEYNCVKCDAPDTRNMVQCDTCDDWFHYKCVGVKNSVSERPWQCERCKTAAEKSLTRKSGSKSISSRASQLKLANFEEMQKEQDRLALEKSRFELHQFELQQQAEKEKRIFERAQFEEKQKRQEAFMLQKQALLENLAQRSSVSSSVASSVKNKRTESWVVQHSDNFQLEKSHHRTEPADLKLLPQNEPNSMPREEPKQTVDDFKSVLATGPSPSSAIATTSAVAQEPPVNPKFSSAFAKIGHLRSLTEMQIATRLEKEALPTFSGAPGEWPVFIATYNRTTTNCAYTDDENLGRLIKALSGNARKLVKGRLRTPTAVKSIIETLYRNYGRPDIILDEMMADIEKHPKVTDQQTGLLLQFSAMVEDLCITLQDTCSTGDLNNPILLRMLIGKLPYNMQIQWALHVEEKPANLTTFNTWLIKMTNAISMLPKPIHRDKKSKNSHTVAIHDVKKSTSDVSSQPDSSLKSQKCFACNNGVHDLHECKKFLELSRNNRWTVIKKYQLCRSCLSKHSTKCPAPKPCGVDGCQYLHHALLHNAKNDSRPEKKSDSTDQKKPDVDKVLVSHHQSARSTIYRIAPVYLYGPEKKLKTYAFIDEGSSTSLIEEDIANQLELTGPSTDLCLRWTNDVSRLEENSRVVTMDISGVQENDKRYRLTGVNTVKQLMLPSQTLNAETISKFNHLKQLPIEYFEDEKPTMIIGLDNYRLVVPLVTKSGNRDDLIGAKTRLGWTVYGAPRDGVQETRINFHLCECGNKLDKNLQKAVDEFWSLDSFGIGSGKILESKEDIRAKAIMEDKTRLLDGRYETGLLWRHDNVKLPASRNMALRRLICFENKLLRDRELMMTVNNKIMEHVEKGYVRKLMDDEIKAGPKTWYLPIFVVQNPNKPAKIRLVWDAAAKAHGVSLNDFLLKGPDNLTPLTTVLFKFRENKYAVSGDIQEMYHRVMVNKEDADAQRFLWRNCDRSREPDVFVMSVMTFGATCSPSLAQHVKNTNAQNFIQDCPRAVDAIQSHHYVDDLLDSFETIEEAIRVINEVIKIHSTAGFHIRGWRSSDARILDSIGQTTESESKSMSGSDVTMDKVLGMWWQTDRDLFVFRVNKSRIDQSLLNGSETPTKRQVLSIVMSTFDPLGLLSPFIVHGKVILQEIWKAGVDWDEKIGDTQMEKWTAWTSQLKFIEQIEIPRRYFINTANDEDSEFDLHIFCDAGGDAYAASAYVRNYYRGRVEVSLIASKTRVNPKTAVSVPRLELLAAVLGVRLMNLVTGSHSIKFRSTTIWSDSTTVLGWLRSETRRYKQFVALRISECLESTNESQWRYVPSKMNVADLGTKWPVDMRRLASEWITGPTFLHDDPSKWPEQPNFTSSEPEEEIHHRVMFTDSNISPNIVSPNLENMSSWWRMVRSQAFLNRAINNFKKKQQHPQTGQLTTKEMKSAEAILFRKAQWDEYKKEVVTLMTHKPAYVDKSSGLYSFSPYLDDEGVMRVRGRIDKAKNIPFSTKRPVILPRNHIVTRRILENYHKAFLHQNHSTVINEVRKRYAIPKLRVLYAQIRTQCQYCKIQRAIPEPPEMAVLSEHRVQTHIRPFYNTGIDLFGPLQITIGRRVEKRWCSLFTCLSTRAIHLELVNSLSTDSCIRSLIMFMARRGVPRRILTDNGTNFHGANNALVAEFEKVVSPLLLQRLAKIEWTFIPPGSPHFGGAWERLIKIVKDNLKVILTERKPNEETLRACLCEIEVIVNTRPLTHISLDAEDAEALTPNHFLHGTSDGCKLLCEVDLQYEPTYKDWRFVQWVAEHFWRRFIAEYLPNLTRRTKWYAPVTPLQIGDLVLVIDERNPRGTWPRGRIVDVVVGGDGAVRSAVVRTATGLYTRPAVKLARLDVEKDDQRT